MLLNRRTLDLIEAGHVDLAFRRWRRPTVRAGGTLRTVIGVLDILSVEPIEREAIDEHQARRAGFAGLADLLEMLDAREGQIYRVELRPGGPDPRVALREDDDLSAHDVAELIGRLDGLDRAGRRGGWTRQVLRLIQENPHVRAQDLADAVGLDKPTFKRDVRKLKELGLTISHSPGYEVSPRGAALLEHLD